MTDRYLSRADWGANTTLPRLGFNVDPARRTEVHVHHTAAVDTSDFTKNRWTIGNAIKYQRQLQTIRPDLGKDIPYTEVWYVLENLDVAIMEGRGLARTGAHTAGHNTAGLGWAVAGNFDLGDPDAINVVIASIDNRIRWLRKSGFPNLTDTHPAGRIVYGHRDTKATACPGAHLFAALPRITLEAPTPPPSETPPDDAPADDVAILAPPTVTLPQLQRYATTRGATARYRELMFYVWHQSAAYGVDPAVPAAIMDHETAGGHFGGVLGPEHHNWGGIKTTTGGDNSDPDAHARFPDDETGVRAVIQHAALYAGVWIPGELRVDPRHFDSIRGTAPSLLSDGWRWAGPDHGPNVATKVRRIRLA
jgi:hypothetical protein